MKPANSETKGMHSAATLYVALELGSRRWVACFSADGEKRHTHQWTARDYDTLMSKIASEKKRLGLPASARVVSCYEAGRDGFSVHRRLEQLGVESKVVDSSSIKVDRRRMQEKTDQIDARELLQMLVLADQGGVNVWREVRPPSPEQEDARRPSRERERLVRERGGHSVRIVSLLKLVGVTVKIDSAFVQALEKMKVPPHLKEELHREFERWLLVNQQVHALEKATAKIVREADQKREEGVVDQKASGKASDHKVAPQEKSVVSADRRVGAMVGQLASLRGIGLNSSWIFAAEFFAVRNFRNRRELAACAGLAPIRRNSDQMDKRFGISKAGSQRVRDTIIEIAWQWLRFQPQTPLSQWFDHRFAHGNSRIRRRGIVAVARKLLIQLWRFAENGVVPDGAVCSA